MRERRKFLRAPLSILIRYRGKDNREKEAFTGTVGGGGLFIETPHPMDVNEDISMEFHLPGINKKMSLQGKVVWKRDKYVGEYPPGMGIKFTSISHKDRKLITEVINDLLKRK